MTLSDHVRALGGTETVKCAVIAAIAARVCCSAATLYMISKGHKRPSPGLARAIEGATDGAVTRYELRPDIFGELPPPIERAA